MNKRIDESYKSHAGIFIVQILLSAFSISLAFLALHAAQKTGFPPGFPVPEYQILILICFIRGALFILRKSYNHVHDHHPHHEVVEVIKSVGIGSLFILIALFILYCFLLREEYTIFFLLFVVIVDFLFLSLMIFLSRLGWSHFRLRKDYLTNAIPILIVGYNEDTIFTIQSLGRFSGKAYKLVAVVDTSNKRRGRRIAGAKVIDLIDDIELLLGIYKIELVFTIESALPLSTRLRIEESCKKCNIRYYQIPGTFWIIESALKRTQSAQILRRQRNIRGENSLSNDISSRIQICQDMVEYLTKGGLMGEDLGRIRSDLDEAGKRADYLVKAVTSLEEIIERKIAESAAIIEFQRQKSKDLDPLLNDCRKARLDFMAEKLKLMLIQFQIYCKVLDRVEADQSKGEFLHFEKPFKTIIDQRLQKLRSLRRQGESILDKLSQSLDDISLAYLDEIEIELNAIEDSIIDPMSDQVHELKREINLAKPSPKILEISAS